MTKPVFINTDSEAIIAEIVADYEAKSGKTLQPAQPEMLLINTFALREKLIREAIQNAGLQMLISFASAPALDYLVKLVGVTRLSPALASCTLEFTLTPGHGGVVIPSGTRIGTTDGKFFFSIGSNLVVAIGVNTITASGFASVSGEDANGYTAGTVIKILDPWPFVESATNTDLTAGGANEETDDELRERAILAPSQFSVAGPTDAYKFFAKGASSDIIDVAVTSPVPGTVNVYPLVTGGVVTPPATLTLVENALNDEKVRPLTDTVVVLSPTVTSYDIVVDITTYTDADPVVVVDTITAALEAYVAEKASTLGGDIKTDHIVALCVYDNSVIFDVAISTPGADLTVADTAIAVNGSITVNIIGTSNG